jgi:hypothetical protein
MAPACHKPSSDSVLRSVVFSRIPAIALFFLIAAVLGSTAFSADTTAVAPSSSFGTGIVIGFVGGFVHRNDPRHSEVQLAEKLSSEYGGRAHVAVFENRHRQNAYTSVLNWLNRDGVAGLSDSEKRQARIILYGHSWGASAVLALARQLQGDDIPVLLTIQVDSISKPGLNDHIVPANVMRAINFFQTGGALHGEREIIAADPDSTQILGDFRFDYQNEPAPCAAYPWFARHFLKGHISIECDPKVWSRVEALISQYLLGPNVPNSTTLSQGFLRNP